MTDAEIEKEKRRLLAHISLRTADFYHEDVITRLSRVEAKAIQGFKTRDQLCRWRAEPDWLSDFESLLERLARLKLFTPRELQIMTGLFLGYTIAEIAGAVGSTESTIYAIQTKLRKKFDRVSERFDELLHPVYEAEVNRRIR